MTTKPTQTLRLERTYDASPWDLWAAWTDSRQYAKWFNPFPGADAEILVWELRVGGTVKFNMVTPDGQKHPNEGQFLHLDPPRELVTGEGDMRVRVTFEPLGARRTRLVIEQTGLPMEVPLDQARQGWGAILDKLQAHAATVPARELVLTRDLDAPRERVWAAWTDPRQLDAWFGPDGFRTTTHELQVRRGGLWRFTMRGPDGHDWPNRVAFDEVTPPERLHFMHGSDDEHPDMFRVTVTFEDLGGGRTRLTLRQLHPTVETREHVAKEFGAVERGHETLARLAEHLAKAPAGAA